MGSPRLPGNDPRTLARDIPGLFEGLFPHLIPGVVAHLNRHAQPASECVQVSADDVRASTLARAMLFELAVAAAEQLLAGSELPDWEAAMSVALVRQRRHFDAIEPAGLNDIDKDIALRVAQNLTAMLGVAQTAGGHPLVLSPTIPGYQWIATGVGDFSVGACLIEVKCTNRRFMSADYRQILMYWLLSYAAALEGRACEWTHANIMNPRLGFTLTISFDELIRLVAAGRSKVELLAQFATFVGERKTQGHAL